MGVTGLETAFAVLHTDLVLPGVLTSGCSCGGWAPAPRPFDIGLPSLEPRKRAARSGLFDPAARGEVGATAGRAARATRLPGRELTGRVLMTVAGGRVAYRERSASRWESPSDGRKARPRAGLIVVVDVQEAFAKAIDDFERGRRRNAAMLAGASASWAARAGDRAVPQGPGPNGRRGGGAPPRGHRAGREGALLRPRPRASRAWAGRDLGGVRHRDARLRQPDGRTTSSPTATRCRSRRTRSGRAPPPTATLGLEQMERAGAAMTSVEMALFELLGGAGADEFKQVQALVK